MESQIPSNPSLERVRDVVAQSKNSPHPPNLVPITASIPADLLTPTVAYLKLAKK
jgi:anthranilate synthase component 1